MLLVVNSGKCVKWGSINSRGRRYGVYIIAGCDGNRERAQNDWGMWFVGLVIANFGACLSHDFGMVTV